MEQTEATYTAARVIEALRTQGTHQVHRSCVGHGPPEWWACHCIPSPTTAHTYPGPSAAEQRREHEGTIQAGTMLKPE